MLSADGALPMGRAGHCVWRGRSANPLVVCPKHRETAPCAPAIPGGHAIPFRLLVQIVLLPSNAMIHVSH